LSYERWKIPTLTCAFYLRSPRLHRSTPLQGRLTLHRSRAALTSYLRSTGQTDDIEDTGAPKVRAFLLSGAA